MKKLMVFACAALLLAGCGSSKEKEVKKESKTCSIEEAGMGMAIKMDAEDDIIKNIEMTITMPSEVTGLDASTLSEDDLKEAGKAGLANIGVEEGTEGVTATFKAKGKDLEMTVGFDLKKTDAEILKQLELSEDLKDTKLSDAVNGASSEGFTCK